MRISEVAAQSGLSIDTIRYYEMSGICPVIQRDVGGKRVFSAENLGWLVLLASLRETGMPTKKMKQFADLYQRGDATISERKGILAEHETHLEVQQARLAKCKNLLGQKIGRYNAILGERS